MQVVWLAPLCCSFALLAQDAPSKQAPDTKAPAAATPRRFNTLPVPEGQPLNLEPATRSAIDAMLRLQEGEGGDEWPYQGVYREDDNA